MSTELEFNPLENVLPAFITPIGRFQLSDPATLNKGLKSAILEREQNDAGVKKSGDGGWHSRRDLLRWPQPEVAELRKIIKSAVNHMICLATQQEDRHDRMALSAWANVNRRGSYHAMHHHPYSHWSGVYYVETGEYSGDEQPGAGKLIFYDPRGSALNMLPHPDAVEQSGVVEIQPKEGMLLIYPAWLQHSVNPFQSDTRWISIAFNAKLMPVGASESTIALA